MYDDNTRIVPQHTSRKRPRSNEEDNSTFMPCSKKILEDADDRIIFPETSSSSLDSASKNRYQNCLSENVTATSIQKSIVSTSSLPTVSHYSPELSFSENPFYYHINGVLYEAHMQRLVRLSNGAI